MRISTLGVAACLAFLQGAAQSQNIPTPPSACAGQPYCMCGGRQVAVPGGCANQNADCRCVCGYSSCPQKSGGAESSGGGGASTMGNGAMMGAAAHGLGAMLGAGLVGPPPPLPTYNLPKVNIPQNIDDNAASDEDIHGGVGTAQNIINGYTDSAPAVKNPSDEEGDVPTLLRGDQMRDCQGKNLFENPECADISLDTPALQRNSAENQKALADGAAFERRMEADQAPEKDVGSMQDRVKDYLKDKVLDKATDKLEDIGQKLGLPMDAIKRVKEGGGILKNYATKTLKNFDKEASNAACALGSGSLACADAYQHAQARQQGNTKEFKHDTYNFVGNQYGAKPKEGGE